MRLRSALLVSSAMLTLTVYGGAAHAQGVSRPLDTGYGNFVPLSTGASKSYANGQIVVSQQPAPPPPLVVTRAAPITAPAVAPAPVVAPVARMAPIPDPVPAPVVASAAPQEQPTIASSAPEKPDTAGTPPAPSPIAEQDVKAAQPPVPEVEVASRPTPEITTVSAAEMNAPAKRPVPTPAPTPAAPQVALLAAAPVLDEVYPEEREAKTRIAMAQTPESGAGDAASRAARALAELPPVPEDIIRNEPLSDVPIREIAVEGLERIEPLTVQSYLDVNVGETLTAEKRNASLKRLYNSGLFADVAIAQNKDILTVEVKENPQINAISFEGNKRLKDDDLKAEIQIRQRSIYTRSKVLEDTDRVLNLYRRSGRYAARVEPKIIERDQNRVDIVFEINEGPVTDIRAIRFVGNKAFDDSDLRDAISTKTARWYRFYASDDRYDPDRFNYDQELLRQFYLKHGYADFKISSALAELSPDQENFYLTFTVEEGERYKVGKVSIDSKLKKFDAKTLDKDLSIETGDWYNADKLNNVVDAMTTTLGNAQYAFAAVKTDVKRNPETKTVDITFQVNESPKVYVERIDIEGNVRTLDKVVRREFELAEGDPYNKEKLAKSQKQIRDLNFFKNVDVNVKEGTAPDQIIIDAKVEEQSTGDIQVGAGFSTLDGPLANFSIRERNLLGKGQDLRLGTTIAGRRSEVDVNFTEPYFLNRKLAAGVDLFHVTRDLQDESSYDQKRTGGGLRLGYDLSENWRQSWRVTAENNQIDNVQDDASRFIKEQEGKRTTVAMEHRIAYDTRDSKVNPREGWNAWLTTEIAGLADAQYFQNRLGATWYHPLTENWTFAQMGEVGHVVGYGGKDVEINERFFIGGQTMRGFEYGGIGPRDINTDDALGGNTFYRGTSEVTFPISIDSDLPLKGHLFSDYGSLFDIDEPASPDLADQNSIRVSLGVGVSWESPFGPLRLDVSRPIVKEEYDQEEPIRFSFGTSF